MVKSKQYIILHFMSNKKTHGGKRPNSGRKPADEKKVALFAYVLPSQIETVGGKEAAKIIAEQAIEKKAKNILK